jgi:predicted DNA-binding protein
MDKKRSRIISFRLSPEEYESLKNHSESNGARSISEFTRSVACRTASNHHSNEAEQLDHALENLNSAIDKLGRHLHRLNRILEVPGKPVKTENKNH